MKEVLKLLASARPLWRAYVFVGMFTTLLSLMSVLQPMLSGWAIDEMRKGDAANIRYAIMLAGGIFLIDISQTVLSNINGFMGDQMSRKLQNILSERYFTHLLSLPQSYYDTELSGKIINRLNRSIVQIASFVQMFSNNFLQFIFTTVFSLIIVFSYSVPIGLLLFALYPIFTWMTVRTSDRWQRYQKDINNNADQASGRFAEAIGQVKVVKSFVQERRELRYFGSRLQKIESIVRPQSAYWHKQDVARRLVLNVIFFGVYIAIFVGGSKGLFTPGEAVALILYAMNIRIPIFTISFLVENTQRAIADSKDYFEVMQQKPAITDVDNAKALKIKSGAVRFDSVQFGYDADTLVLKDISFNVQPDSKVALVGESGEGKTTITNLLLRLYEVRGGLITIDGQDITKVTQRSLRESIGVVFQEPGLFSGTIRENITYAKSRAAEEAMVAAAKAANAHEFIEKLELGYDTQIGEHGLRLSGGQKQRIAIARALFKDPPILILDEATSSLDSKSEALVQEALEHLMKNRTTIIIAHRLSTIANVDQIVTIAGGVVTEAGSPAQLAKSNGVYAQLLALQKQGTAKESTKKRLQRFDIAS
jgi:ATP-binding cassette subfamily B protein